MVHQSPSLLEILRPTPRIVTPSQNPHRPSRLPLRHQLRNARGIRLLILLADLREAKLSQHHRHAIHNALARGLEPAVPQPALDVPAIRLVVLVVVQLEHELVGEGEVGEPEARAVA